MRRVSRLFLAAAAIGIAATATPAMAGNDNGQYLSGDPCTAGYITGAIACQGYYGGNLITGGATDPTSDQVKDIIAQLLNGTPSNPSPQTTPTSIGAGYVAGSYGSLGYGTILGGVTNVNGGSSFVFPGLNLSGLTILGAHFGNNTDSTENSVTAFWLVDLGPGTTNTINLSGNSQGTSNAEVFATSPAGVPEPATWGMMLLGFGGIGMAMRRGRKSARLPQIA